MPALFGRAWNIQVLTPADQGGNQTLLKVSSSDRETQSLRVTFDIEQSYTALFQAEVRIYNPNLQTLKDIPPGSIVSVSAGYEVEGIPAEIFRGPVFQTLWGKEEAHTTVLTLLCFVGLEELTNSFISASVGPLATQREVVLSMAANCQRADGTNVALPIAYLAPESDFKRGTLPRSSTIFGTPNQLFGQIARMNDMGFLFGPEGIFMGKPVVSGASTPDVIYSPPLQDGQTEESGVEYRLIGTPVQTELGVDFRVLLDSRLTFKLPAIKAQLKNAAIAQSAFLPPKDISSPPPLQLPLNADGVYFVTDVRHVGDTRGNIWETQVGGMASIQSLIASWL